MGWEIILNCSSEPSVFKGILIGGEAGEPETEVGSQTDANEHREHFEAVELLTLRTGTVALNSKTSIDNL